MNTQLRGYVDFPLGQKTLHLHITMSSIAKVEEATGKGMLFLLNDLLNPLRQRVGFLPNILYWFQDTKKDIVSLDEIQEIFQWDIGLTNIGDVSGHFALKVAPLVLGKDPEKMMEELEDETKKKEPVKKEVRKKASTGTV